MKNWLLGTFVAALAVSCTKVEEKINETVVKTTETVQRRAVEAGEKIVKESISESVYSALGSEEVPMIQLFPDAEALSAKDIKGRKIKFPNGSEGYIFRYKAEKAEVLSFFESQKTTDNSKSDVSAKKIDGQSILKKISFIEKFLPENLIDNALLSDLKTDRNIEFYKLKRYPSASTFIINPKDNTVLQYVEIEK